MLDIQYIVIYALVAIFCRSVIVCCSEWERARSISSGLYFLITSSCFLSIQLAMTDQPWAVEKHGPVLKLLSLFFARWLDRLREDGTWAKLSSRDSTELTKSKHIRQVHIGTPHSRQGAGEMTGARKHTDCALQRPVSRGTHWVYNGLYVSRFLPVHDTKASSNTFTLILRLNPMVKKTSPRHHVVVIL
jgi:hypothetical protein